MKLNVQRDIFIPWMILALLLSFLMPSAIFADATISGTIEDGNAQAIEELDVYAFAGPCWDTWIGGATTDASGNYTITIETADIPGSNEVYVYTDRWPSHQNYVEEWYDDIPINTDCNQAVAVAVTDGSPTTGIDFQLKAGPPKIEWFDMYTSNGIIESSFAVRSGYYELVESAVVSGPGLANNPYDIVNGKWDWLNECMYIKGYYDTYTGVIADGEYTLTVTFTGGIQETATFNFSAAGTITPVATKSHTLNNDGSISFEWMPPDTVNQRYRIQIRSVSDGDRYYASSWMQTETTLTANAEDLRCLVPGETYQYRVRARNAAGNGWENGTSTEFVYNPSSLDHQVSAGVDEWKGILEIYFNTRPGSRNTSTVTSASVAGPNGFAYTFDLVSDWYDLSTPARLSFKGWAHMDATWPITGGDYTFTIQFSDGSTVTETSTFTPAMTTAVDVDDMEIEVHADGVITFEWELPDGVTNQLYQVRVRSLDGSKEWYSSPTLDDDDQVEVDFWDLSALAPGQTYQWFVRAWDDTWANMRQSESLYFYYAPGQATGTISGTVSITGTSNGGFAMGAFPSVLGYNWYKCNAVGVVDNATGAYTLTLPAGEWFILSVQDADESGEHDDGEPVGFYTGTTDPFDQFGLPVSVPLTKDQNITAIDFTIYPDEDGDEIRDVIERGPLGTDTTYDGNSDGTADRLQSNVASFPSYDKKDYITLAVPGAILLEDVLSKDNPSPTDAPADMDFNLGFFSFTINDVVAGGATTATLYLPVGETPTTYYKYGPTPDNPVDHWYEFMYDDATKTGAVINGNVITLHFVDGKRGDDDLTANGTIEDVGGPAKTMAITPGGGDTGGTSSSGSSGGGGGCFISTIN
jgi:hypothetical protein